MSRRIPCAQTSINAIPSFHNVTAQLNKLDALDVLIKCLADFGTRAYITSHYIASRALHDYKYIQIQIQNILVTLNIHLFGPRIHSVLLIVNIRIVMLARAGVYFVDVTDNVMKVRATTTFARCGAPLTLRCPAAG